MKRKIRPVKPTSPLDIFFGLGEKVTKGDPKRKADFNYYMMWIIFLAFFLIFIGNIRNFWIFLELQYLGWSAFALAVMWFQYQSLTGMWHMRKLLKEKPPASESEKIEGIKDMLNGFKK